MKVTVLGCGGSGGVPTIDGDWGNCDKNNIKNKRLRSSICVDGDAGERIIVDTGPDFRQQMLQLGWHDRLDAILYTHAHADHIAGIDDTRKIAQNFRHPIDIFGHDVTIRELVDRYPYIFEGSEPRRFYPQVLTPHVIEKYHKFGNIEVVSFEQAHGSGVTMGYRFNDFGYSTDVAYLPEESLQALEGIKIWIVGAAHIQNSDIHAGVERVMEWSARIKPKKVYLTHLNLYMDYDSLQNELPDHIEPGYDGLVIDMKDYAA